MLLLLATPNLYAQKKSKADKYYQKAYMAFGYREYSTVFSNLDKALSKDSNHVKSLQLYCDAHYSIKNVSETVWGYKRILAIEPHNTRALIDLGIIYLREGMYSQALSHIERVQTVKDHIPARLHEQIETMHAKAQFCMQMVENPIPIIKKPLPATINSPSDEYWPYVTADGKNLYFTRTDYLNKLLEAEGYLEENIYVSKKVNGAWKQAQKLPDVVNTVENEGAQIVTQDGKCMYFTACNQNPYQSDCNIYVTYFRNSNWTKPQELPAPVNSPYKETQPSISFDGRYLFFTSNRPGGQGGMDIWVSRLNEDSVWSKPLNLGKRINTPKTEESPFIHVDNNTLYFSSNGHPGLGDGDLFMVKLNDTLMPVNMGYPINDHRKQLGIMVSADGKTGYYSSVNTSPTDTPSLDIHEFEMPPIFATDPICYLDLQVMNEHSIGVIAEIQVINSETGFEISKLKTDQNGNIGIALPNGKNYQLVINKKGYLVEYAASNCELSGVKQTIKLTPIGTNKTFVLSHIYFDFDQATLQKGSYTSISQLAKFMAQNPDVVIEIGGHTDSLGTDSLNLKLSLERAKSVKQALLKRAELWEIKSAQIKVKGYGEKQPLATNATEKGRALNRRTEIKVLSTGKNDLNEP
ncbi:MAG: PD40 domain-containing protein [Bacteroidetes bacterium]|nr:PD40 domain-containing protein [Bacteroidota bacterium]